MAGKPGSGGPGSGRPRGGGAPKSGGRKPAASAPGAPGSGGPGCSASKAGGPGSGAPRSSGRKPPAPASGSVSDSGGQGSRTARSGDPTPSAPGPSAPGPGAPGPGAPGPGGSKTPKSPRPQQVYTLLVEVGRTEGDGLPDGATGAALMCYASGVDEPEAVRETVAVLKTADLSPIEVTGWGTLAEREEAGEEIPPEDRALMDRALAENAVIVAQVQPFYD